MADFAATKRPYLDNFVRVAGHRMRFVHAGEGVPVVLVHGFGLGNTGELAWAKVIPGLAERFHAYAPDLLGFGKSDKPAIQYSPQAHVNQLLAFMDCLCLDRVLLMGNSVGAYIALKLALDYPDRATGVCAIASSTIAKAMAIDGPDTPGLQMMRTFNGTAEAMRRFLREVTYDPRNISEDAVAERLAFFVTANPGMSPSSAASRQIEPEATHSSLRPTFPIPIVGGFIVENHGDAGKPGQRDGPQIL